ncbi:MAG: 8-oxo-dGTP diphosphatase [Thermoanaerobaculia bacterium]
MKTSLQPEKLSDIDWASWSAQDLATLLFVIRDGRMLLIRKLRGLGAGKINAPGGRLDDGESPIEAAVREVEEELRITPLDPEERGELKFQFVDGYSIHGFVFRASEYRGEPTATDEAIPLWTPVDRIPYEEMWADDRHWLPLLLEGRRFSGRFLFDGDAMLDFEIETT